MFLLKIIYYAFLFIILVATTFFGFAGALSSNANTGMRERIGMAIASIATLIILWFAFRVGHGQSRWAMGIGLEFLAALVFVIIMAILLLTGKIHWQ